MAEWKYDQLNGEDETEEDDEITSSVSVFVTLFAITSVSLHMHAGPEKLHVINTPYWHRHSRWN